MAANSGKMNEGNGGLVSDLRRNGANYDDEDAPKLRSVIDIMVCIIWNLTPWNVDRTLRKEAWSESWNEVWSS